MISKFIQSIIFSTFCLQSRGFQHHYHGCLLNSNHESRGHHSKSFHFYSSSFQTMRRNIIALPMASEEPEAVEAEIVVITTPALQLEQKSQAAAYRTSSMLYAALGLDTWKRRADISIFEGASKNLSIVSPISMGVGFLIAAVSSYCLIDATEHNRLSSDTYKRINLALAVFSCMNSACYLVTWPFLGTAASFCNFYNISVALNGWTKGIKGLGRDESRLLGYESYLSEVSYGFRKTFESISTIKSKVALGYLISLVMASVALLHNIIILPVVWNKSLARVNAIRIASTSRLFLVSSIIFTLMDAANRGRLKGSTFIYLNISLAVGSLAGKHILSCILGLRQRFTQCFLQLVAFGMLSPLMYNAYVTGKVIRLATIIIGVSLFTGTVGIKNFFRKRNSQCD